jgi:hypothetical protein
MKKYIKITGESIVNQNDKVRRISKSENLEFYVIGWDESKKRYRLLDVTNYLENNFGLAIWTSTQDLIDNFEVEV